MTTNNKTSSLVSQQLPAFVRTEGPKLQAFIEAYYEYMEQNGKALSASKNLLANQDIDTTDLDQFVDYFRAEILKNFPKDALVDKRLIAKLVRDLYRQKGSEKSFKFLFRALYNEDVDIYLPGDYVLRTSDGRWIQETYVRVSQLTEEDAANIQGEVIIGQTSGAYGRVQGVNQILEIGQLVTELLLTNVIGEFLDTEIIKSDESEIEAPIYTVSGPIQDALIQKWTNILPRGFGAGVFHKAGDSFTVTSDIGSGASGTIIAVNDKSSVNVAIIDGGSGYQVGTPVSIVKTTAGLGANAVISAISNTTIVQVATDTIDSVQDVVLNTGPTFVSLGSNTTSVSANLASANISSTIVSGLEFANTTVGTISAVNMLNYGAGYTTLPTVSATDPISTELIPDGNGGILGDNAVLGAVYLPGAIEGLRFTTFGSSYSRFENIGIVNASRSGTVNAVASPILSGTGSKEGRYISTKGFISWDMRLQDSFYYQDFSYAIRSNQFVDTYRQVVNDIVHPSGTIMFGEYLISSVVDGFLTSPDITSEYFNIIEIEISQPATSANVVSIIDPDYNDTSGQLFIYNYQTIAPFLEPTVGTGVPTTVNAFGEIAIGDLNGSKLVFGNNSHFNSNGATLPGYIRQLPTNANVVIGNGGTSFNTDHKVGDMIWSRNTANEESIFVKIISIANATHMVTNPALTIVDGQYQANTLFAQTANSTSGAILKLPPPILDTYDIIIFNSQGANTDGQYAVNVVSSVVNSVMSISSSYSGPTLSNGQFAWINPGFLPE